MIDVSTLPTALLVPFSARRLSHAYVAMANPLFTPQPVDALLETHRYIVPTRSTEPSHVQPEKKTFFAERYGSVGISRQGGGARVGISGAFQVKGIGCTPLLGSKGIDFAYSNGELPLGEAIREMIWGEVLNIVLPHGAVRSPVAIGTEMHCRLHKNDRTGVKIARGLLVREFALRPAHFVRAVYYKPRKGIDIPLDSVRVRDAIARLPELLPMPDHLGEEEVRRLSAIERLYYGLGEVSLRFARQHAVARARRFMHGALTASNICLDGRWIDYDSLSRPPVHGSCRDYDPSFWFDHERSLQTLHMLWLYLCKYFPAAAGELPKENPLTDLFIRDLNREMKWAFLELTGIPMPLLERLQSEDRDAAIALSVAIIHLAKSGTVKPFDGTAEELHRHGTYDMAHVMVTLAIHYDAADCDERLREAIPDDRARSRLIDLYRLVSAATSAAAAVRDGWHSVNLKKVIALNAIKRSAHLPILNGGKLMQEITDRVLTCADPREVRLRAEDLFRRIVADVQLIYGSTSVDRIAMDECAAKSVHYDAVNDSWLAEGRNGSCTFPWIAALAEPQSLPRDLSNMETRWGFRLRELANV